MKPIKILQPWKIQLSIKLQDEVYCKLFVSLIVLTILAAGIWLGGPYVTWQKQAVIASTEKRIYIILFLFFAWLLKFLMLDLATPHPLQCKDKQIQKKLFELKKRFQGALHFLRSKTVVQQHHAINLNKLPWFLLIGPRNAGKTTLLANSNLGFILQKQFQDVHEIKNSDNCDWWVTRNASIIDVPGNYLSVYEGALTPQENKNYFLWTYFINLLKKKRGRKGIHGIFLALPLSEFIKNNDKKYFNFLLKDIANKLHEIKKYFSYPIPCKIILTKCDLLPGFNEFFAETSREELIQPFGITLSFAKNNHGIVEIFETEFNSLIRKINQQLLWRIHQERNPLLKPYIKDFPLQIERIKEFTLGLIKNLLAAGMNIDLQGIYITSAIQPKLKLKKTTLDHNINTATREVKIIKEPPSDTQAYFIKQLLSQGFTSKANKKSMLKTHDWRYNLAYAFSASTILATGFILGKDFYLSMNHTYAIQKNITDYKIKLLSTQDPAERIADTIALLTLMKQSKTEFPSKLNLSYLLAFYSNKAQDKQYENYQQALRTIFPKEIKNYFEDYLLLPVNKNAEDIYAVLKAYLMIGDSSFFNAQNISRILLSVLPKTISKKENDQIISHLQTSFQSTWPNFILNDKIILNTRKYLLTQPELNLSYIILKNMDNNNLKQKINLTNSTYNPFIINDVDTTENHIPTMFTIKSYSHIMSQGTILAAQETMAGNWILGQNTKSNIDPVLTASLIDQLRMTYINNYINAWEHMLNAIHLNKSDNLSQVDAIIINLMSDHSPLLQLLKIIYENTYFEPIISSSVRLQHLGQLIDNKDSHHLLYEIFASLQSLHKYLQLLLNAENEKKAAFDAVTSRMLSRGTPDPITQLRMVAEKSPEPIRHWLSKIADDSWGFLMRESGHYIDTTWQNHVYHYYQVQIANRYPFNSSSAHEIDINNFIEFFGNPGILIDFFNEYLQRLVDISTDDWHWKKMDGKKLPFSDETLRQIQQAMRIHYSFFPNHDNKPFIEFILQPYEFGKSIKSVMLNFNNEQFVDVNSSIGNNKHIITWPNKKNNNQPLSIQLTLDNAQTIVRHYPGNWGWYKLLNQSFESMISKKQLLINLSLNEYPAKYVLVSNGKYNPYVSLNLQRFHLSQQLFDDKI